MIGIVTSAVRDTITNAMLATKLSETARSNTARHVSFFAQQRDDRIGQRHGAEGEFLTLVDIVFNRNAVYYNTIIIFVQCGLKCDPWIEGDDPRHNMQQRTRYEKGCIHPHAARGASKMIEQECYRQQLRHRTYAVEPCRPWTIRTERADDSEREECNWQETGGMLEEAQK
jgi:hypothetical protein